MGWRVSERLMQCESALLRAYVCLVCAVQQSLEGTVAVVPRLKHGGESETQGQQSSSSSDAPPDAAGPPIHANSAHYRSFASDCVPIPDFHTRRRDHTNLEPGTLDDDGMLAHTDFDIDMTRVDLDNEEFFQEFLDRRTKFEENLKLFYDKTPSQTAR